MAAERKPNRLAGEKSPYLLQHAHNPVEWYPWGPEALQKARDEDKPIFLSIGYSTCHWCHVMEHESFENEEIAAMLNESFVPIKVDREERPDLDEVYMRAIMSLTGQGGWPLSVFLTPDLKPFYGGTYFPDTPRHGMPSFPQVLEFITDLWKNKREEIKENSEEIIRHVQRSYQLHSRETLPKAILDSAYAEIVSSLDEQYGGFSTAPKFPLPNYIEFLMRYYRRTKKEPALRAVKKTLQSMAAGGIHDQVGGGFHRYSTDRFWLVPHFEKMLYDNAQLARVYLEAYQLTSERSYFDTAKDTLDWLLREMRSPEGGFYSAQDADTKDGEGYYYTWTPREVADLLGEEEARFIDEFYGVTAEGNFEGGRSILHVSGPLEKVGAKHGFADDGSRKLLERAKAELLKARGKRSPPATDDKVISSWNGLAIAAFAYAYQVTGEQRYLDAAKGAAAFLVKNLIKDRKLLRRYRDGQAAFDGGLEDYSFVAASLIDLYETTFEPNWLRESIRLTDKMVEVFWDGAGFKSASGEVLVKVKDGYDGPTPSGNSVAALTLLRLSELTGREDLRLKAEGTMKAFGDVMESTPHSHTYMLSALDFWFGSREIVVAGERDDGQTVQVLKEVWSRFLPNKVLAVPSDGLPEIASLTDGKLAIGGKPTVYICENFACRSPITDIVALRKQLDS